MDKENFLDEITPDMLPAAIRKCAKAIGIKALYNLCLVVGGQRICIPKPEALLKCYLKKRVIEDYQNGNTTQELLAKKYDLSEKTVWNYIKGK